MPLNKICVCIKPPIVTFPMERDGFSTGTAGACSSRLHLELTGAAGSTSGKAHRAPQTQHHSLPTNNPTKTHPISWCCCYCQDFQGCSFPGEIHGMNALQIVLHLIRVASFQASIQAVGAPIFSLWAHLRLVQVKVNQWQSLMLQLCKGGTPASGCPNTKARCWRAPAAMQRSDSWDLASAMPGTIYWAKKSLLLCQKVSNSSWKAADGTPLLCQAAGCRNTFCSSKRRPALMRWRVLSSQSLAGLKMG